MRYLMSPTTRLHASWLRSYAEWGVGVHQDGSGFRTGDDVESAAGFAAWVARLHRQAYLDAPVGDGPVPATFWWIVEDDEYLGAITLRHCLTPALRHSGGHIGYGVRPSARRRGLATWALAGVLPVARVRGLDRVLIVCRDDNAASARTVEHHGGVLADVRRTELGPTRRYWIDLTRRPRG